MGISIRSGFVDGFLFPYQEVLALAAKGDGIDPEEFVAFAPDEHFNAYSYGSELLTQLRRCRRCRSSLLRRSLLPSRPRAN